MPVVAVGRTGEMDEVVDSGSFVIGRGRERARVDFGDGEGVLNFLLNRVTQGATISPEHNGQVTLNIPYIDNGLELHGQNEFNIGSGKFKLDCRIAMTTGADQVTIATVTYTITRRP